MDLFCQSSHSWQVIFLQEPGFLALPLHQISDSPYTPCCLGGQALGAWHFQSKQPCRLSPVPRTPEAAVPGNQQEAGKWIILWPSTALSSGGPIVYSEQTYFPPKAIQKEKNPAFCTCTLALNGIKSFHLVQDMGSAPHCRQIAYSLCVLVPHLQGWQDASQRDYEFKDWHS